VLQGIGLISVWLGPSNRLNVPAACLVPHANLTRDCSGSRLVKLVFRPLFGLACCYLSCSLGSTTRRMFRSYGENSYRRRLVGLAITEHAFILLSDSYKVFICLVDPIY
jgi:hypothetical protein